MTGLVKRSILALFVAGLGLGMMPFAAAADRRPACDPDNGGITLPPGFCALVAADDIGPARHIVVAPNGDVYVALMADDHHSGGIVALRDSSRNGRLDTKETFGTGSSTGVGLRNGYLYVAHVNSVERFKMTPGQLKPSSAPETVVSDLPGVDEHGDKGIAFDGKGSLYVNVGAPSNACQPRNRQKHVPGQDPCQLLETHGGVWKFDENKLGQKQSDGVKYATGMRQMPAITWYDGALYIVMNNRDQLDTLWPENFTAKDNAERPAEPMYHAELGANYGWPYCFYDYGLKKLILAPEYGGDGKKEGRCTQFALPVAAYPAHWAPVDVIFYTGTEFPAHYRGGAFIAFHGSWNRAPLPQAGSNVTFQPFSNDQPSGKFEIFADGFAGQAPPPMNPDNAVARADGVAQAPDGSLYIGDSQKGRIWHVFYQGGK